MQLFFTRAKDVAPRYRSELQMAINRGRPKFAGGRVTVLYGR
jgi:hypothetical protein